LILSIKNITLEIHQNKLEVKKLKGREDHTENMVVLITSQEGNEDQSLRNGFGVFFQLPDIKLKAKNQLKLIFILFNLNCLIIS
jgi:hypothetical protein